MLSAKMQKSVSTKYYLGAPLAIKRKRQFLLWMGVGLPTFLSSVPLMGRYSDELSLLPVGIFLVLGFLWQLVFKIGHKVTPFETFKKMTQEEKQERLLYDSFWYELMRCGVGLYAFLAMLWWLVELSPSQNQLTNLVVTLLCSAIFMFFCVIYREQLVTIAVDGLHKHKKVSKVVAIIMGIIAASQILGGVTRMARVTMGEAEAKAIIIPIFLFVLMILILSVLLLTFLGILITYAHYYEWKSVSQIICKST